ncbi:MAG: hypothetical protein B9S32_15685 [Verrucomicrobia bacterium Tous-C9LFEB]|nr:MAG: hypothetical protein B9S32_15685 [Verrucomicrobia bacterium Tous-C9LFEB]
MKVLPQLIPTAAISFVLGSHLIHWSINPFQKVVTSGDVRSGDSIFCTPPPTSGQPRENPIFLGYSRPIRHCPS